MKKLLIDARLYGLEHTGIGRYITGLVTHLPSDPKIEVSLIVHPSHVKDPALSRFPLFPAFHHPYTIFRSQLEIHRILLKEKPDLVHIPHFTIPLFWRGRMIVTIHDLIKHESRGGATTTKSPLIYWPKYVFYMANMKIAVTRAAHIIVPTNYWKEKLISIYNLPPGKISVTYEGVDEIYFQKPSRPSISVKKPYVIYVGNVYPHKNVRALVKAVLLLSGRVHLYVSCARGVFWSRMESLINELGAQKLVTHLGFVPDSALKDLHNNALAFVTASKIEGLGLPGLEAMAAGTPVIASNASCLPEVYDQAALYFDPDSPEGLARHIENLLKNNNLRQKLIKMGKDRVKLFSWQKMARETWEIYAKHL